MPNLSYKTRGNSSPQGKERVYFACHPADFNLFFEPICADIFQTQNCAVWYRAKLAEEVSVKEIQDEEAAWTEEDLALDLGKMQLFVIPVTSRFLHDPNHAREVEFKFAQDHHIPILLLMQEPGLEEEFNTICDELQFLDKQAAAGDATALPYEEKLKNFLSSVLLGDDLAAKVRDAFDAYIFLSYRKKDRKYAQELMRLIHENPFCRDIAIWYDEFLTPGENFNDAIRDAMEKSSLFALAVTPNLVNEKNYVMSTEYPEAKKAGMPILPAELVKTDRKALRKGYPGLPEVADAHNTKEMSDMLECLRGIAVTDNDDDRRHIFFIGLAYLNGIDMEVNTERALEMITRAAEAGLEEAIEKLANMYRRGDGVPIDYGQTIRWQERLVEARKRRFEEEKTGDSADECFNAMSVLYNDAWNNLDLKTAGEACRQILELAAEAKKEAGIQNAVLYGSYGCLFFGNISGAGGKLAQQLQYYEEGLETARTLGGEEGLRLVCDFCERLAQAYRKDGKLKKAAEYFEEALRTYEEKMQTGETTWGCRKLAGLYFQYGGMYLMLEDPSKVREMYEKSLFLLERTYSDTRAATDLIALSETLLGCAELELSEGELEKAETDLERALNLQKETQDTGEERAWLARDQANTYRLMAELYRKKKNYPDAEKYGKLALESFEQLRGQGQVTEITEWLSLTCTQLSWICRDEGKLPEARKYAERAMKTALELAEKTDDAENRHALALTCSELGELYRQEKEYRRAREMYEKSLEITKALIGRYTYLRNYAELSACCRSLGDLYRLEKDPAKAWEYYEESLRCSELQAEEAGTRENYASLGKLYMLLSYMAETDGRFSTVRVLDEKTAKLSTKMRTAAPAKAGEKRRNSDKAWTVELKAETALQIADRYNNGKGVAKDYGKAAWWFSEAAKQGSVTAIYNLGVYYLNGYGVGKNVQTAAAYMLKAARAGDAKAQDLIGYYYKIGQGVPKDEVKAAFWFGKAAEQGVITSMYELSLCYEYGKGVPKDMKQTLAWLTKAAESGYAQAQFRLGTWYHDGIAGPRDCEKAAQWYLKAAQQGHQKAKEYLKEAVSQIGFTKRGRWKNILREQGLE